MLDRLSAPAPLVLPNRPQGPMKGFPVSMLMWRGVHLRVDYVVREEREDEFDIVSGHEELRIVGLTVHDRRMEASWNEGRR